MNTHHLKYFIDAVRLSGVAASAEHNFVTHSAVSQSIRALEKDLGVELLLHEKKKFQLTDQGRQLFSRGQLWLDNLHELKSEVRNSTEKVSGVLSIASPQSVVREILWKKLIRFRKLYPDVKVRVTLGPADLVGEQVRSGKSDIGFLLDQTDHGDLRSITLEQGKYILISKRPSAKAGERPLIVSGQNRPEVQSILRGLKRTLNVPPEVVFEIQSWSLIQKLVKEMDVFGIVPEFMVKSELEKGQLHAVKLGSTSPEYDILGVWTQYGESFNKVKAFLELIKA